MKKGFLLTQIRRFEDIEAWRAARLLTNGIYDSTDSGEFGRDFAFKNQIRRAAVSIVSNIAEGYERDGDREFIQFLFVAKGSCGEVRAQLYLAHYRRYLDDARFQELFNRTLEVSRMIDGLIKYLRGSAVSGRKFKPS